MRSIPRYEQETIIRWAADETMATISTSNPVVIRKPDKLTEAAPDDYKKLHDLTDDHDARYLMPVDRLRFAKPSSDARREAGRRIGQRRQTQLRINSERETQSNGLSFPTSAPSVDTFPTQHTDTEEMHERSGAKRAESNAGEGARA